MGNPANTSPGYEIAKAKKRFTELFGLSAGQFMDSDLTVIGKKLSIDIVALDDWMREHEGYEEEKDGSLSDFIKAKYGEEAEKFVSTHL